MRTRMLCLVLVCLGSIACSGSDVEGDVLMTASQTFGPQDLTVSVGDAVVFANDSKETHTVTAYEDEVPEGEYFASGGFGSEEEARGNIADGLIDPGETFEATFDTPGTYEYFCFPHETNGMTGTITVE